MSASVLGVGRAECGVSAQGDEAQAERGRVEREMDDEDGRGLCRRRSCAKGDRARIRSLDMRPPTPAMT